MENSELDLIPDDKSSSDSCSISSPSSEEDSTEAWSSEDEDENDGEMGSEIDDGMDLGGEFGEDDPSLEDLDSLDQQNWFVHWLMTHDYLMERNNI